MLGYESEALIALGITFVFTMIGTNTMLFLTGLATLDPSLEEAAELMAPVDGGYFAASLCPT